MDSNSISPILDTKDFKKARKVSFSNSNMNDKSPRRTFSKPQTQGSYQSNNYSSNSANSQATIVGLEKRTNPVSSEMNYAAPKFDSVTEANPYSFSTFNDKTAKTMSVNELNLKSLADLRDLANQIGIENYDLLSKQDLIFKIIEIQVQTGGNIYINGVLQIMNDNSHGIVRVGSVIGSDNDVYVSSTQIRKFNLRMGDQIGGQARPPKEGERYLSLLKIEAINNRDPELAIKRPTFEKLVAVFPNEKLKLETDISTVSTRIIDMLAPIGKGQRGMVVAQPKSGKTILLKEIALGIKKNHPEVKIIIILIGERPEEVTDIVRTVGVETIASNFDEHPQVQTQVAEIGLERAKRLVEMGEDVVILMDSITRLARAYNTVITASGRTLSGGLDPFALYPSKKFFGAARNFEFGGSLTMIATALVDTGSKMDDVIFEEFKGTGNMELKLDRKLAEKRIFPAIDILSSGTRNEDLLLSEKELSASWRIRRMLDALNPLDATDVLVSRLKKTQDNDTFYSTITENI